MNWLQDPDAAGFRFVNQTLSHPFLDWLMPLLSGNVLFAPALVVLAGLLLWKGGVRGRLLVLMLLVVAANNAICDTLKDAFARPRPFLTLEGVIELGGRGGSYSLPSSHAANWAAGVVVVAAYYRRWLWPMVCLAGLVGFSRVYVGVHYPLDVLAGYATGAASGFGGLWLLDRAWGLLGRAWFPLWWRSLPSLRNPALVRDPLAWHADGLRIRDAAATAEKQWLHLGYLVIAVLLAARLGYLASGKMGLSEDEAYQWVWSKHLDWSYFSKPPMIAYTQFLGTRLWGDTVFGIRFFAPVIAAGISLMVLRFFAREVNARAGFWLILAVTATPLMSAGSVLMTIDPLSVLFWTAAMLRGWQAVQKDAGARDWLWVGVWLGLGFLSKYTAALQLLCFGLYLALWPGARRHWRRAGPYLAAAVMLVCALPVVVWNAQHGWITVAHLQDRAGLDQAWRFTTRFLFDFTLAEMGLLNPVFFGAVLWAVIQSWRKRRHHALTAYLLCMGAPLFVGYWLYCLRARVQPNWIAPAVVPLFCVMAVYGDARWRAGVRAVKHWLVAGLALGLFTVVVLHDTRLIGRLTGYWLPPEQDPLRRVHGWRELAGVVQTARQALAEEGQPVFIIADHYGTTGLLSFYHPEAKAAVRGQPLVYFHSSDRPLNQFYFWPGYRERKGQNALFVQAATSEGVPDVLNREFDSVTYWGMRHVVYREQVLRQVHLYACRNLR